MNRFAGLLLIIGILFFGCAAYAVSDIKCQVNIDEKGSGHVSITFLSSYDLSDEIKTASFGRDNVTYSRTGSKYNVDFDFISITEISTYSRFSAKTVDNTTTYTYNDKLSFFYLTGQRENISDFEYCVQMPAKSKITSLRFDGRDYPDAIGKNNYCVVVDGKYTPNLGGISYGQDITIVSQYKAEGCEFDNPSCTSDYNCINNSCVLKSGCRYSNPVCDDGHTCAYNECVLKSGCLYNNSLCENTSHDCVLNECQLKPGCVYNNPACDSSHSCYNNTCELKQGCRYDNPLCDTRHSCIDNECILKEGCEYDNPKCSWYESCDRTRGACGVHPIFICIPIIILLSAIFIALVSWVWKRFIEKTGGNRSAPLSERWWNVLHSGKGGKEKQSPRNRL
jgi:hypothetical protein